MSAARLRETELGHDGAEAAAVGVFLQAAEGDDLRGDLGECQEMRAGILFAGGGEVDGDELLLAGGDHEGIDVLLEAVDVVEVEPVVEAVAQRVEGLGEHAVVGQPVGVGRVDGGHVEATLHPPRKKMSKRISGAIWLR